MITIGKPYILQSNITAKLCADINEDGNKSVFFFEVPVKYSCYLCDTVSDAFLVGIMNYAFAKGIDITVDGFISERLLYQINSYYLKTLPITRSHNYKPIHINAIPYKGVIQNKNGVCASASGGVDSFYTIFKHTQEDLGNYKLTHILLASQFNHYENETENRERFKKLLDEAEKIADNYNLSFIPMFTNHNEYLFDGFVQEYSLRICSYAFALQKLFSVYYVSSGVPFKLFDWKNHDSDGSDIFNLSMMSTNNLTFYSSGGEVTRTQKIDYFSNDLFIQKHLKVCNFDDFKNCSECEKCLRTMLSLDIIGKLDEFKDSFDLKKFKIKRKTYLSLIESRTIESSYDLLENIEKYKYKVPVISIINGKTIKRLAYFVKQCLKKIRWLKVFYYKYHFDYLIHGKQKAIIYRYGTEYDEENSEKNRK